MNLLRAILVRQYTDIGRSEWPRALLLSAYFFLVIATFWILKPLKRGMLIDYFGGDPIRFLGVRLGGAEAEQLGKVLNMVFAYIAVMLFTWLARRLTRQQIVVIFAGGFSAAFAAYAAALPAVNELTVWSFYVFGDMFNTVMVALFWAFTNDVTTSAGARRTYGVIGLGGVVGGFVGATVVNALVRDIGRGPLLLFSIAPMAGIAIIAIAVSKMRAPRGRVHEMPPLGAEARGGVGFGGGRMALTSPYLLGIAGIVASYEVVSNIIDYQLAATVERLIPEPLAKDAFFAQVGQLIGLASIGVQLLFTGFVMQRLGIRLGLLLLPVTVAAASLGFFVAPALALAAAMSAGDNALSYSINQSAKEALYTAASTEAKYKGKAFIDMFVQRAAKGASVGLNLAFAAFTAAGVRWLSLATLAVVGIWIAAVHGVSERFRQRTEEPESVEERAA